MNCPNNDLLYTWFLLLTYISGGLMASLYWVKKIVIWRIRWIELEHDLARVTGREPRDIESL